MIIIEGMDNSGKTALAERLAEQFQLPIIKRSGPPISVESFLLETLAILILEPQALFDRHPIISESIYGPILRGHSVLDMGPVSGEYWIDRLLRDDPLIIYCRPPDEYIFNFKDGDQMVGVKEHSRSLLLRYDRFMDNLRKKNFLLTVYDYRLLTADARIENVVASYLKIKGAIKGYEYK